MTDSVDPLVRINFVGAAGVITGTMVISNDPKLCEPYMATPGYEKEV